MDGEPVPEGKGAPVGMIPPEPVGKIPPVVGKMPPVVGKVPPGMMYVGVKGNAIGVFVGTIGFGILGAGTLKSSTLLPSPEDPESTGVVP